MGACLGGSGSSADDRLWRHVRPNEKAGETALEGDDLALLGTLIATKKVDVNSRREGGDTALHWVCREQAPPSVATIEWLCAYKPDLELQNDAQKTPLHCAAGGRVTAHITTLIRFGANVNAAGAFRSTPVMCAAALGLHANIEALMADPACDVSAANANADTPLNRLARLGSRDRNSPDDLRVAEAMIARGANVNTANAEGFTPLLSACVSGKANLCALFVALGAALDARNTYGEGIAELATREHIKFVFAVFRALSQLSVLPPSATTNTHGGIRSSSSGSGSGSGSGDSGFGGGALDKVIASVIVGYAIQRPDEAK